MHSTLSSHKLDNNTSLILICLISFLFLIQPTCCDRLRQSQDDFAQPQEESATGETKSEHQPAEPEYIKRELKDIIRMKIDTDRDGQVSYEELKNYLADLHERNIEYNVNKQWIVYSPQIHEVFSWEGYEPEKKEVLTWDHYFNQTYPELVGIDIGIPITREQDTSRILSPPSNKGQQQESKNKSPSASTDKEKLAQEEEDAHLKNLKLMVARADARWKLADENGDTLLTKDEFKHLLRPDEGHEELQNLFVREATEDMDLNKDGSICLEEFMKHLQVLASEEERNDKNWLSSQQENFGRFLDKNKDGVLDGDELKNWLVPKKSKKFQDEATRLLDIGDANEDHKLTSAEILEHYQQYLTLLPPDYWKSESDELQSNEINHYISKAVEPHDEL